MQINNKLISEEEFCSLLKQIFRLCLKVQLQATEFEIAFLMACLHFKNNGCYAVVLEVGVGGIHDATNVVKTCVSVVCSVSLDHTRILGNSVDLICEKKAGIFKPGTPALIGPDVPLVPASRIAHENNAIFSDFATACKDFQLFLLIHGLNEVWEDTDDLNSMLSLFALCLASRHCPAFIPSLLPRLSDSILTTAIRARPVCRWEKHCVGEEKEKIEFVLDMGHNPAALQQLVRRTQRDYPRNQFVLRIVLGISRDKDVRSCIRNVMAIAPGDHFHFVQAKYFRAMSSVDLYSILAEESGSTIIVPTDSSGDDISQVLHSAKTLCQEEMQAKGLLGVVIVCGSGYIMPDARAFLGIIEPRYASRLFAFATLFIVCVRAVGIISSIYRVAIEQFRLYSIRE